MTTSLRSSVGFTLRNLVGPDGVLSLAVILAIGVMIVPLAPWALDLLLTANLSISVTVLLIVLYAPHALKISAFPSVLLVTTLMRLALNIASTRLILLRGEAGAVIRSFGTFVVEGNYVVGGIVFLLLTIVQFMVVAKGSERVAEVGARFALDALPGRQLAIDAEVRAGALEADEARKLRQSLLRESHFYGAMEGAMKFVKGDVVASLLIYAINIVGGVGIGIWQRNLDLGGSLRRYTLLTVGDGLVTQIPALVLATSAGILVTRVASSSADSSLGQDLAHQLLESARPLRAASMFLALLALVPGLPTLPFLVIAGALFLLSQARQRASSKEAKAGVETALPPLPHALSVSLSADVARTWAAEQKTSLLQVLDRSRTEMLLTLGVVIPPAHVLTQPELPDRTAMISIFEIPARTFTVAEGGEESFLARMEQEVRSVLHERASDFLGVHETRLLLDGLEKSSPTLVRHVVPKVVSVPQLTELLRGLLSEGVAIRDLRLILDALATLRTVDPDPGALIEAVRSKLARSLTYLLTGGQAELRVHLLDPSLEETVRFAVTGNGATRHLALDPTAARDIVRAIRRQVEASPTPRPVLLTQPDIRRFVHQLTRVEMPELSIISPNELLPQTRVLSLGRATVVGLVTSS